MPSYAIQRRINAFRTRQNNSSTCSTRSCLKKTQSPTGVRPAVGYNSLAPKVDKMKSEANSGENVVLDISKDDSDCEDKVESGKESDCEKEPMDENYPAFDDEKFLDAETMRKCLSPMLKCLTLVGVSTTYLYNDFSGPSIVDSCL